MLSLMQIPHILLIHTAASAAFGILLHTYCTGVDVHLPSALITDSEHASASVSTHPYGKWAAET